jgi:hypothetical protein
VRERGIIIIKRLIKKFAKIKLEYLKTLNIENAQPKRELRQLAQLLKVL